MSNTTASKQAASSRYTDKERLAHSEEFLDELTRGIPETERGMVVYAATATPREHERKEFWARPWRQDQEKDRPPHDKNDYACISSSIKTKHPTKGHMRFWRDRTSFGHGLALMVDDIGSGLGSKGGFTLDAITAILPPTAVVETSPGNFHCWYFLDAPEPNKIKFKAFLDCFAAKVLSHRGGDTTIVDITRLGRLPTGINNKHIDNDPDKPLKYIAGKDKRGHDAPFDYVHLIVEATDYDRRYSLEEIAKAFGFKIDIPKPREPSPLIDNTDDEKLLKRAEGIFGALGANGKRRLDCPFDSTHRDSAYFWGPAAEFDHPYGFKCSHHSCTGKTWKAFWDEVLMPESLIDEYEAESSAASNDPSMYEFLAAAMNWNTPAAIEVAPHAEYATVEADPPIEGAEPAAREPEAEAEADQSKWRTVSPKEQREQGERTRQERERARAERDQQGRERNRAIGAGEEDSDQFPTQRVITVDQLLDEYVLLVDGKRVASLANPRQAMAFGDFEARFAGSFDFIGEKSPKRVQRTKTWLDSKKRKGVWSQTFDPSKGDVCMDPHGNKCQNLWRPIVRPPIAYYEDLAQPFFAHIKYLIPIDSEMARFLDWLAHIEQFPGVLPHTHYLMIAKQTGIGRNLMAGALVRLWRGYVASSLDMYAMLKNGYNGQLAGKLLFIADEIHAGAPSRETSQMAERMNMMFTEYERLINPKYGRQHVEFNCCRGLLLSNHIDATPILGNDRREIVIRNPDERQPPSYYKGLYAKLEDAEFITAIGLALRARDISAFNPGELAPMNEIKERVIAAGRSEVEKTARDIVAAWPSDCISSPRFGYELATAIGHGVKSFSAAVTNINGVVSLNRKVRVNGEPTRIWILRNADVWEKARADAIAEEVMKGESLEAKELVAAKAKIGVVLTEADVMEDVKAKMAGRKGGDVF